MKKCKGVIPPIVTPFKQNGDINEDSLERLVKFLSEEVHGLFVCGKNEGIRNCFKK